MGWLRRLFGGGDHEVAQPEVEEAPPSPALGHNLLVVTDIHLGEMLKDRSRIAYLKASTVQDREFCDLLEHYQAHSPGDRPWRLILGGDIIDFLQVTVAPDPDLAQEKYGFRVDRSERKLGLDNSAAKVKWKLHRVMDRHRMFFTYLADFIGRGNEVVVIRGNHDAEFFWTEVHRAFKERLAHIYFGEEAVEGDGQTPDDFKDRIRFHPWFYYEPDRLWMEHGHQHDAYCSLEHLLYPVLPWDRERMEWPAVSLAVRWGVNLITGFTTHEKDDWTFLDYIRWTMSARTLQVHKLVGIYVGLIRQYFKYYSMYSSSDRRPILQIHQQVRRTLAEEAKLPDDVLRQLGAQHKKPDHLTLEGTINISFVDRWALIALNILCTATFALAGAPWWQWLLGALMLTGLNVFLLRKMSARLDTHVAPKQREAAVGIRDILPVRYVVMGHSHVPEVSPLPTDDGAAAWYVNTGSWLHYEHTDPHPASDDDALCDCGLTHVVMLGEEPDTADEGPELELRRWCVESRRPVSWIKKAVDPD